MFALEAIIATWTRHAACISPIHMRATRLCLATLLATAIGGCDITSLPSPADCVGKCDSADSTDGQPMRVCSPDDWCWSAPEPVGTYLLGVRRLPDDRLVAFGGAETLLTSEDLGRSWSGTTGMGWQFLSDAWVDVDAGISWFVGSRGRILAYQAGAWTDVDSGTNHDLRSIWGISSDDIWAVGDRVVLHWDGRRWSERTDEPLIDDHLAVWASGPDDVWLCGFGYVMHFDGANWRSVDNQYLERITQYNAIWGTRGGDIYFGTTGGMSGLQRYDRSADVIAPLFQRPHASWEITSIHGTAADDVWAAGSSEVWHFDGERWNVIAYNIAGVHIGEIDLSFYAGASSVHALARNDVWITGAHGHLAHWNGDVWARAEGAPARISSMLGAADDGMMIAGGRTDSVWAFSKYEMATFDGLSWTIEENPMPAKWGGGTVAVFALGEVRFRVDRMDTDGPWRVFRHTDAVGWESLGDQERAVGAIWASGVNDVFIGGDGGVQRYDGSSWSAAGLSARGVARFHGASPTHIWAHFGGTAIYQYDGSEWRRLEFEVDSSIGSLGLAGLQCGESIWTDRPGHGFIGCWGALLEIDGERTVLHDLPGHQAITTIVGTTDDLIAAGGSGYETVGSDDIYVEREYGAAYHFDGASWVEERSGVGTAIWGGWRDEATGDVWAVSGTGIVRRTGR